jgi:hypothetical protein
MTLERPVFPPVDPARRRFLSQAAGVAVSCTVMAPVTIATAAAAAAPSLLTTTAAEDPRLLALGEQIEPLLTEYRACAERRRSARALAESLVPPLPPEMIDSHGIAHLGYCDYQCDVEGNILYREPRIIEAEALQGAIDRGNLYAPKRSKFGKRVDALLKAARDYEAKRAAAIERSEISEALLNVQHAASDLEVLAYKVREIEPITMAGVIIQARALTAHAEAELDSHGYNGKSGAVLGRELASAVLRIVGKPCAVT